MDAALVDVVELLRAEMCCTTPVALLESDDITTPATVGWRQPAVLLPIRSLGRPGAAGRAFP